MFSEEVINNLLPMRTRFNEVILDLEARLPLQKALGLLKSLENVYPEEQPQMLLNEEQKKELGSILYALSAPTLQQDS